MINIFNFLFQLSIRFIHTCKNLTNGTNRVSQCTLKILYLNANQE